MIRYLRSTHKDLTKSDTKVKIGDLSTMPDNNVLPRRKLSPDKLKTRMTEQIQIVLYFLIYFLGVCFYVYVFDMWSCFAANKIIWTFFYLSGNRFSETCIWSSISQAIKDLNEFEVHRYLTICVECKNVLLYWYVLLLSFFT